MSKFQVLRTVPGSWNGAEKFTGPRWSDVLDIILTRTIQVVSLSQSSSGNKLSFKLLDGKVVAEMWRSRFGIPPEAFEGYYFYERGKNIWIFSRSKIPDLRCDSLGVRSISTKGKVWKPSTYALQIFGPYATKNCIDLDWEDAGKFIAGLSQSLEADLEDGYVVVRYGGEVLGCGLYTHGMLVSQLPKERRIAEGGIENLPLRCEK